MLKDFFILIFKGLVYRPLRSWLTILGIIIGITLVVVILSLSSGIKNAVTDTLQMFGSNLIVVLPGKETDPLISFFVGDRFKDRDIRVLEKVEGVEFIVPEDITTINLEFKGEKKSTLVHAISWPETKILAEESQGFSLTSGQWPVDNQSKGVIMGSKAASNLFKNRVRVGDEIIIKSKRMKVAGILSGVGEQTTDNLVFISIDIFRELTGRTGARSVDVKIAQGYNVDLVAKQIKFELSKQESVQDFSVITPKKADRLAGNVLKIIELALIVIAIISLIVGAVGIMNTMYTSVLERTKYVGVMKALGATNEAILSLFLIESGIIGLVGGISGIILGVLSSFIIGLVVAGYGIPGMFSFASLDFLGFFTVLFVTFVTGVVAGILPARRASKMEPAEALRYE